jgi:MFS family permease
MVGLARRRARDRKEERVAAVLVVAALIIVIAVTVIVAPADKINALTVILGVAAVIAGMMVAGTPDGLSVSASFIVYVLAGVFLGARSAVAAAVLSELAAAITMKTRVRSVVLINLPASVVPAAAAALVSNAIASAVTHHFTFYLAVAIASMLAITLSFAIWAILRRTFFPAFDQFGINTFIEDLPSIGLNVLLVVAGAAIAVKLGNAGIAFALSAVFTFSYMAHLLQRARRRSEQYVSLSWGVLAGLMRSLDVRDQRAARHAAAVARFSRDMAGVVGMSE